MKIKFLLILLVPAFLFSAGTPIGETDIFPRTVNFILWVAILYYFLADKIKDMYKGRIKSIADRLDSIQQKVKDSVAAKETAQAKVQEAKANAKARVETSKKEAQLLTEKVESETKREIDNLQKSFQEKTEVERRKMVREMVREILDDMFGKETIVLDKEELVKIVMKKVA